MGKGKLASNSADWRVLIVEDDRAVARIHCRHVSRQPGFTVVGIASSGTEARKLISTLRPDLVLLDLSLPLLDGASLLRGLRSHGPRVEVIVISAHSGSETVLEATQLGVIDYLVKPFWPSRLTDALKAFSTRMETLQAGRLDQAEVDRVRNGNSASPPPSSSIKADRLAEIRQILVSSGQAISAGDVAESAGLARVTARRYLEHLVALGQCTVDHVADGPGRPRKLYRPWLSGKVGSAS